MKLTIFLLTTLFFVSAQASTLYDFDGLYVSEGCQNTSGFRYIVLGNESNKRTIDYDSHVKSYNNRTKKFTAVSPNEIMIQTQFGDQWGPRPTRISNINLGVFETSRNSELEDYMGIPLDLVTKTQGSFFKDDAVIFSYKYKGIEGQKSLSEIKFQDAHFHSIMSYALMSNGDIFVRRELFENSRWLPMQMQEVIVTGLTEGKSAQQIITELKLHKAKTRKISYSCTYKKKQ